MKMPYLGGALKGWTAPTAVLVLTKTVVDHQSVETPSEVTLDINWQPMPAVQVNRKPEEQRTWQWWTLTVKGPHALLKIDDVVTIGDLSFRIQSGVKDWRTSGVTVYEAIEGFTPNPAVPEPST